MSYDDTSSRRSYGGRSSRDYDDRYGDRGYGYERAPRDNDRARGDNRSYYEDRQVDRRPRNSYYEPNAAPADNSALAHRSSLPAAYYEKSDPSVRSGRSQRDRSRSRDRDRSRSLTPERKKYASRRGDIMSAAAGAIAGVAIDKFLVEPRMKQNNKRRSKSHNETIRRVADVGIGGAAGTAIYRAVSRSRARKKGALADSRPGSPDSSRSRSRGRGRSESRGRADSRDSRKERSRSKSVPWKSLISTAGGALAGLAAEQIKNRGQSQSRRESERDRGYSDDDSDQGGSSRRRHRSADDGGRSRGGGSRRGDYSDDDDDSGRHRSSRRSRSQRGDPQQAPQNPHEAKDLIQEAIGLLGVANGLRGHHKKQAAVETAIGAAGLAQNYYEHHRKQRPMTQPF